VLSDQILYLNEEHIVSYCSVGQPRKKSLPRCFVSVICLVIARVGGVMSIKG
jgi:hypothetical protein